MKLSVIIPAYNEEKLIAGCIALVQAALAECLPPDWTSQIIVVDNNSSDATAELAAAAGAEVVFEPVNQISRARNAGGSAADGDWLLFIDADSYLCGKTVAELVRSIGTNNIAGGGCLVGLDADRWGVRLMTLVWETLSRTMKWAAGSFVFCRAEAFRDLEGFSTDLYAAEEIEFSGRLKRWAKQRKERFTILTGSRHVSSGRKFSLYTNREIAAFFLRSLLRPFSTLRDPKKLDYFYDGRR